VFAPLSLVVCPAEFGCGRQEMWAAGKRVMALMEGDIFGLPECQAMFPRVIVSQWADTPDAEVMMSNQLHFWSQQPTLADTAYLRKLQFLCTEDTDMVVKVAGCSSRYSPLITDSKALLDPFYTGVCCESFSDNKSRMTFSLLYENRPPLPA
jgi:hypothetical protein